MTGNLKIPTLLNTRDCTGCGVCALVCPAQAIAMKEDKEGFPYPRINKAVCIGCGLCERHCHLNANNVMRQPSAVLAARIRDKTLRERSTSGGAATAFARAVLQKGGVVAGAAFDPFPTLRHVVIETDAELHRLAGSKYLFGDCSGVFPMLKRMLQEGRAVLFIGLPCQTAALRTFLGGKTQWEHLFTIDLICHGGPPQKLFSHFVQYAETIFRKRISDCVFRCKEGRERWKIGPKDSLAKLESYFGRFRFDDWMEATLPWRRNWYMQAFLDGDICRRSCLSCRYAKLERASDIVLGDCWGGTPETKLWDDPHSGASLILSYTPKGMALWREIADDFEHVPYPLEEAKLRNGNLIRPTKKTFFRSFAFRFLYLNNPTLLAHCNTLLRTALRFLRVPRFLWNKIKAHL